MVICSGFFLFIFCTETLISLLNRVELEKHIMGLRVAQASPQISHILFADVSLFFCKAEVGKCLEIVIILNSYEKASGQRLNSSKSSLMFGKKKVEHNVTKY